MKTALENGGIGYGHIKKTLLDELIAETSEQRAKFNYYMENFEEVKTILDEGAIKARKIAQATLARLKENIFGVL